VTSGERRRLGRVFEARREGRGSSRRASKTGPPYESSLPNYWQGGGGHGAAITGATGTRTQVVNGTVSLTSSATVL